MFCKGVYLYMYTCLTQLSWLVPTGTSLLILVCISLMADDVEHLFLYVF